MAYEWDNKKPTAQMLGRWQPFHDGHYTLFKSLTLILLKFAIFSHFGSNFCCRDLLNFF